MSGEDGQLLGSWHDNAAAWTDAVRSGAIASRKVTDAAILAAILERRPQKVLDLGCGEGWLMRALTERGCAVVGVDGSAPLVAAAGADVLQLSYAQLVAEPRRAGQGFDLVVANFALLEERIAPLLAAMRRINEQRQGYVDHLRHFIRTWDKVGRLLHHGDHRRDAEVAGPNVERRESAQHADGIPGNAQLLFQFAHGRLFDGLAGIDHAAREADLAGVRGERVRPQRHRQTPTAVEMQQHQHGGVAGVIGSGAVVSSKAERWRKASLGCSSRQRLL